MSFYTSKIKLVANKLDYQVPDIQKISGAKYKWSLANRGKTNTVQGECCFEYNGELAPSGDIESITEKQYADFAKVTVTVDKTEIKSDGTDGAVVTAEFPEAGGKAIFVIKKANSESERVEVTIPTSKKAKLSKEKTATKEKGTTNVVVSSDKWQDVAGFGAVSIESI